MKLSIRMVVLNSKKYVLDLISAIVAAAYGLRRLYSLWTGAAIRVQRSLDDAKADIGFTANGDLDTVTLLAFVGSGNGFVTTWYDQSGNGRHATQTDPARQPRIVSNGVIEKQNGRPALLFDGNAFFSSISVSLPQFSVSLVETSTQNTNTIYYPVGFGVGGISVGGNFHSQKFAINENTSLVSAENSVLNAPTILSVGSNNLGRQISVNGNAPATDATVQSITQITIGQRSDGFWPFFGLMSELMFSSSLLSITDFQKLDRNQGIYFNISVS
jgi:trimeric autotransporter adhesin